MHAFFFKPAVIHGEFLDLMRLMRIGACLSTICRNLVFHSLQIWLGLTAKFKTSQLKFPLTLSNFSEYIEISYNETLQR